MPQLKIIAYTMFGEGAYFYRMSAIGVKGFIVKNGRIEELEKAINEVMLGKTYFSPGFQITNELNN
jgi:DNA-binding NarL/FixJ family response regulator